MLCRLVGILVSLAIAQIAVAADVIVTTPADTANGGDGECSLREAIVATNTNAPSGKVAGECVAGSPYPARDRILFSSPAFQTPRTIVVGGGKLGPLPALTDGNARINGLLGNPGTLGGLPQVTLEDGTGLAWGIKITSADNQVRGLAIGGFGENVLVEGSGARNNWIVGNTLGADRSGANGYVQRHGVLLRGQARDNIIGTDGNGSRDALEWNLVVASGQAGIRVEASHDNVIAGNRIGTNRSGTASGPPHLIFMFSDESNAIGIHLTSFSSGNRIGTDLDLTGDAQESNLISGNGVGVLLSGLAWDNTLAANVIGMNLGLTAAIENRHGITIDGAAGNLIGGSFGRGNVIAGNLFEGIEIRSGSPATIRGNTIGFGDFGHLHGIEVSDASVVTIGGSGLGEGNRIEGNAWGVSVRGSAAHIEIECNEFVDNSTGLKLYQEAAVRRNEFVDNFLAMEPVIQIVGGVTDNRFHRSNTVAFRANSGPPGAYVMQQNWWGATSGPSLPWPFAGGSGAAVEFASDQFVFTAPFLSAAPIPCF